MTTYNVHKQDSTGVTRIITAVLFCCLTFRYLYYYQADVLAVAQNALSNGETQYNRPVGALLITAALFLLGLGVAQLTKLRKYSYALNYFPSLLILAVITDVSNDIDRNVHLGAWWIVVPVLLLLFAAAVSLLRQIQSLEVNLTEGRAFSRMAWINAGLLCLMFVLVALVGNHSKSFHYRAHMEVALRDGKVSEAIKTGSKSGVADSSLTMLRAYALSRKNLMGEMLFQYPLTGGSAALRPNGTSVRTILLGDSIINRGINRRTRRDYILCGLLLDRRIDDFARTISKYYPIDISLPRHYREALILYTHLRTNPVVVYHEASMDADFEDYQQTAHKLPTKAENYDALRETYGNTYWFYYQMKKQ